jgi:hypothetical protein
MEKENNLEQSIWSYSPWVFIRLRHREWHDCQWAIADWPIAT